MDDAIFRALVDGNRLNLAYRIDHRTERSGTMNGHTSTNDGMIAPEDGMTLEELCEAVSNWSPAWDGDEAMHSLIYRFLEHYAELDGEVYAARDSTGFNEDAEILFRYDHETATLVLHTAVSPGGNEEQR